MPTNQKTLGKQGRIFTREDFEKGLCDENGVAIKKGAKAEEEKETPAEETPASDAPAEEESEEEKPTEEAPAEEQENGGE